MKVETNPQLVLDKTNNKVDNLSDKEKKQLEDACKSFEAYFLSQMLSQMRATVQSENKDQARDIYQGWLDTKLSEEMANTGQLGLAKLLFEQIQKNLPTLPEESK